MKQSGIFVCKKEVAKIIYKCYNIMNLYLFKGDRE